MKQNLIQKQLKATQHNPPSSKEPNNDHSFDQYDLTSKAYYITRELFESQYAFTKKSLANFLHGKPILLQQNNKQQPPSVLKGYMNLYDYAWTEEMIEVMIWLKVLKEQKYLLQKKSSTRLFATTKYDWNLFPKIIIKIKSKPPSEQSIIKRPNQGNSEISKNRFTIFLKQKNQLPINEEKRQQEMRIKAEKQKQEQQQKKRLRQEELKQKRQKQRQQQQRIQKQEKQKAKKEQQKKNTQSQINNYWIKEREKIEQFIAPRNDISLLDSPNIRNNEKKNQQAQEKSVIQNAGHVLQMQMKQLKEKEQERRNPLKPIISWSFMKNNIDSDSPQSSQESIKRQVKNQVSQKPSKKKQYKSHLKVQQKSQCIDSFSDSTQVTQTNYKIKSRQKKQKNRHQKQPSPEPQQKPFPEPQEKPIRVFARNAQQSMLSSNYRSNRRSTESIPQNRMNKGPYVKNGEKRDNQNGVEIFSFKRERPEENDEDDYEETVTIAKRPASRISSFEELDRVLKKSSKEQQKQFKKGHFQSIDSQADQQQFSSHFLRSYSQTRTVALPKTLTQQPRQSHQTTCNLNRYQQSNYINADTYSQTITMAQPIQKNQRTSTKGLQRYALTQPPIKRDSFAQELIDNYMRRK